MTRVVLALGLILACASCVAQPSSATPAAPPLDHSAQAKVKRLSQEELKDLNAKLREAMALYYDHSYRLALPLLEEIAARIDTIDVLYWLGHAAYRTGQTDLAIEKFKTILERNPDLLAARVELALAYLERGDRLAAKSELDKALAANPPPALRRQVEQVIQTMDRDDKRLLTSVRASLGPHYDTNVSVGPGDETITLPDGRLLRPRDLEGWVLKSNANLDLLYDFGERDRYMWRNSIYFLHDEYLDSPNDDFNYTQIDARSAVEYRVAETRATLPFGFVDRRFGNEDLSHSFYLAPGVDYKLTKALDLILRYRYTDEELVGDANDAQSNVSHTGTVGTRYHLRFGNADHWLSLFGSYSDRAAEAGRFSYHDWSIGPSYLARLKTGTEVYVDLRYTDRDYDAPARLFGFLGDREDHYYTARIAVSQTFLKNYFVSASFNYIRDDSNVPLFDYHKFVAGINLGVTFNF